jgi:hypothetical protein
MKKCKICNREESEEVIFISKFRCKDCRNLLSTINKKKRQNMEYIPTSYLNKSIYGLIQLKEQLRDATEQKNHELINTLTVKINEYIVEDVPKDKKYCNNCKKILPLDCFYNITDKNGNSTKYSRCKECEREIVKNHEKREEYKKIYNANKEKYRKSNQNYANYLKDIDKNYNKSEKGIINNLLSRAKKRADNKGLEFNLSSKDFTLPKTCPLLEVPLKIGTHDNYLYTYSLDRIDNSKGYTKENVWIISQLANSMKNCATKEQLITFSKNIIKFI